MNAATTEYRSESNQGLKLKIKTDSLKSQQHPVKMPRLNKRQLRELEEVQQLEAANAAAGDLRDDADAEEESDDHDSAVEPARSSFAAVCLTRLMPAASR